MSVDEWLPARSGHTLLRVLGASLILSSVTACSTFGASGPSSHAIKSAPKHPVGTASIKIIDVNDAVARQAIVGSQPPRFSEVLGEVPPIGTTIGRGDSLGITIWEAPPAALFGTQAAFGTTSTGAILSTAAGMTQQNAIPDLVVDSEGMIQIPFAGTIRAAGRTPQQVEREIVSRLTGKAHDPQVVVRIVHNENSNVTVVGDVSQNTRVTLTPRGERLLDVIATAGGVKEPVGKMTIQVTRGGRVVSLPLETIIQDPAENIRMQPDDVVTALFQPYSFISLGATGTSSEVPFEGTGITLAQALGRVGGLRDDRANIHGVFIFRLESPAALDPATAATATRTPDGRIPVIYRVDLSNPATFFVAQSFPIRNKDVVFVSNAPLADLQKFVTIVSSMALSAIGITNSIP